MNKKFIGRVAVATLLATAVSIPERVHAQTFDTGPIGAFEVSVNDQSLESSSTDTLQKFNRSTTTVRVNAHAHESRQAATVYVKDIPVLTYIDSSDTAEVVSGWVPLEEAATNRVIADATQMAAQLEQLSDRNTDFTAHWDDGTYMVKAGDSPLLTLGETVQLSDATENDAENVLQITNRLRRLIGDGATEPITEVIGRPEPQQVAAIRSSYSGMASWYGPGFHGRMSASGESFNQYAMTAAHRTLPFGTQVRVTNLNNGQQVVVRINDRGPFSRGRIIDLSAGAASAIGLQAAGVGPVQVEVLR
ncbi:septal ring lytic transglycosylase RlpA family protein [Leptothoe sp. EHU-05/26/07-4]|uniref:Probable endolytic peptidoglycan transglycosylase RlpA n=1 Tax=Adonisia turfae CCMR0081 TaxID=2292702 RepID=A0A6M0RG16_9CYAN|nr:septal ring lytic transglycosylase RlpA family protein [Adonisia turfae]NEZ55217.1 septal ring lytic transglycosylase RlpA family protein [Adonisia turfae CCMR0081]